MDMRSPNWHREAVGGQWERMGQLQLDTLVNEGLEPQHYLLDVGCGSLRAGIHFIDYLAQGRYFGADISEDLLVAGRGELQQKGIEGKDPVLVARGDFEFRDMHQTFDFALAQSVFTHIPFNDITRCVSGVSRVLEPGGKFLASFFANRDGRLHTAPIMFEGEDIDIETYVDADPYYYDPSIFAWLCEGSDLLCELRDDWGHPRGLHLVLFTKKAE